MAVDDNRVFFHYRPCDIILMQQSQLPQTCLHGFGGHQGEEGIDTIFGKMVGQNAEEKAAQRATKPKSIWVLLTISKAPRRKVEGCEVVCKKSITSSESNSIAEDSTADSIACRTF